MSVPEIAIDKHYALAIWLHKTIKFNSFWYAAVRWTIDGDTHFVSSIICMYSIL